MKMALLKYNNNKETTSIQYIKQCFNAKCVWWWHIISHHFFRRIDEVSTLKIN